MKEYQNPEVLRRLYWGEGLSQRAIAKISGVSQKTILNWMKRFGIRRRYFSREDITKGLLKKLYLKKKLSMPKIAKMLNTTYDVIWHRMRKHKIKVRTMSEAKMKYLKLPFSNSLVEKAYMLGLRSGDISATKACKQITVTTSTTHLAQLQMFKDTFRKYAPINTFITTIPFDGRKAWRVYCRLNNSFKFLLNKPKKIFQWILDNKNYFYAFLAGYADCEACWYIHKMKDSRFTRGRFQIASGDKTILNQIKNKLKEFKFNPLFRLSHKRGYRKTLGKYNIDMYCLTMHYQTDVLKLAKILLKYSIHQEKIWKMKFIMENLGKPWDETKDKLLDFKRIVNESTLNKGFIKELPSLRYDMIGEVLY